MSDLETASPTVEQGVDTMNYSDAFCGYCGIRLPLSAKPLEQCPTCAKRFRRAEATQAGVVSASRLESRPASRRRYREPPLAAVLSAVLPGAGQVYNGQFFKGLFIFCTCWLVIPWLFGILDAYVTASRMR